MKTVYYAHFMGIYNTPEEERNVKLLEALDLKVFNPNTPETQKLYKDVFSTPGKDYLLAFDEVFGEMVRNCDIFAFKPMPDGRISGGVAIELRAAITAQKPIIEIPSGMYSRMMSKDDSREYLRDIGER